MRIFTFAFLLGALALQQQAALPAFGLALPGLAVLLAASLLARDRRLGRAVLLAAAGGLIGFGHAAWRAELRLADALPFSWEGADVELVGIVSGLPQPAESGTRFTFEVEQVRTPGAAVPRELSLTWYRERSPKSAGVPRLAAGERWRFTARLKRPRGLVNPHAFDFEPWALERGIRATGYVRTASRFERLDARVDGWPQTLHRWRGEIREAMLARLADGRLRGVLVALAIGDQDAIAAEDWEVFWRTGVGHLMSISGLHITMLASAAFAAAFFAWVRVPALVLRIPARKAAVVAGAGAALAYTLMTGYAVPAQRTFLMLATLAACVLTDRHGSPSRVLALAVLVVTLVDPWAVLSAGFWLSFGAVAAIFHVMGLRAGRRGRVAGIFAEQLAVSAAMLPMLLVLFQEFSIVSPLANAIAIPVVSLVVVPLAIAGAFLPLPFLLDAAHAVMLALMSPLERLSDFPLAMLESHAPAPWTVMAGVLGCAWLLAPRGVPMRSMGVVWMAPMFTVVPASPGEGEAWLDVLDVGNGLAVVVRTSHHEPSRARLRHGTGVERRRGQRQPNRRAVPARRRHPHPRRRDRLACRRRSFRWRHLDRGFARAALAALVASPRRRRASRLRAFPPVRVGAALDVGWRHLRDAASGRRRVRRIEPAQGERPRLRAQGLDRVGGGAPRGRCRGARGGRDARARCLGIGGAGARGPAPRIEDLVHECLHRRGRSALRALLRGLPQPVQPSESRGGGALRGDRSRFVANRLRRRAAREAPGRCPPIHRHPGVC